MSRGLEFDIGISAFVDYDEDGFPRAQTDLYGEEDAGQPAVEMHHWAGLLAFPSDPANDPSGRPDESKAAPLFLAREGDRSYAWQLGDPRSLLRVGLLNKGDAMVYAPGGPQFIKLDATNSRVTIFNTDNGLDTGRSIYLQVNDKGFMGVSPEVQLRADNFGFHVFTRFGASLSMVNIGGLPPPFDALTSCLRLKANSILIEGTVVRIGDGDTASVAKVDDIVNLLTLFSTLVATCVGSSGAPGAGPAVATFTSAVALLLAPTNPAVIACRTLTQVE